MNKTIKEIFVVLLIAMFLLLFSSISFAAGSSVNVDIIDYGPSMNTQSEFDDLFGYALGVVQIVGSFVSVIALVIIGIKYMIGSVEERAEFKKSMIPYTVGAVFVFAASNIAKIFYDLAQNIH